MGKFFKVLGIIFAVLIISICALLAYASYTANSLAGEYDSSSQSYVDKIIPVIASNWSPDDIQSNASPQLREVMQPEALKQAMFHLSRLGKLKHYGGSKGNAVISFKNLISKVIHATYTANATFENGEAQISIGIVQVNGQWKLTDFYFNSPVLK